MERLRDAGLDPVVGHDAANLPEGAEVVVSTAIGADNPELALARERGRRADPPRRPAGRALRREAADRGRRHPRQDDDHGDGGLGAAGDRRRSRLLRRRRGAGARPGGRRGRQRRLGRGGVGRRRGRRERRQLPRAEARGRRRHQRRDGPPHPLGVARRAARAPFASSSRRPAASCCRPTAVSTASSRTREGVTGFDAGAPGPAELPLAVPGRHNLLNARAALAAIGLGRARRRRGGGGARRLPRGAAAARAEGRARRRPRI